MSTLPTYPWFDQAPDNLKTRRQLAEQGLRPGGPIVAQVVWRRGKAHADLYDVSVAKPKKAMTEAQAAALEKARAALRTCPGCKTVFSFVLGYHFDCPVCFERMLARDRAGAARLARIWVQSPRTVILDTETTDLDGYLVQLAVIRAWDGAVLLDTLINPEAPISDGARAVHGITDAQVQDAPTFGQIEAQLLAVLRGKRVVTYNADFDRARIASEPYRLFGWSVEGGRRATAWIRPRRWCCAMEVYAAFCGDWSDYHGDYRWQPLPGGDHTALGDASATRELLQWMAVRPRFEDELKEEESHG